MTSASSISTNSLAPYTTTTDVPKGLNIEINWDSSVASAPPQFMTDVEQVANFYASELKPISTGPIIIDVGYGEINGSRLGGSALGESETNLQQVSYLQLTSAYAATGLINNFPSSPPSGKFYVSDAEAQALGIQLTNPPTVDGFIGFSSKNNTFDYNTNSINTTSGSVQPNEYDFEGTVAHEISEVLGRIFCLRLLPLLQRE